MNLTLTITKAGKCKALLNGILFMAHLGKVLGRSGWLKGKYLVGCCPIECLQGMEKRVRYRKTVKVIYCSRGLESSSCWFSSLLKN